MLVAAMLLLAAGPSFARTLSRIGLMCPYRQVMGQQKARTCTADH